MTTLDTVSEFFPPTDRELALRGVIHTGWSTLAAKQPMWAEHQLPKEDIAKIQEVLHRAESMDKMEELRIGVFMLKHKQMVDGCRGDGINSCRICGINFAKGGSDQLKPAGVQLCGVCLKGVCQRCKSFSKTVKGDVQILCQVCADQKELWRRSGAWLNNVMPTISLTDDELLKVEEKQHMSVKRNIGNFSTGRSVGSLPREFINPARHESSDETDEEELEVTFNYEQQQDLCTKPGLDSCPLPSLKFVKELHPTQTVNSSAISTTLPRSFPEEKVNDDSPIPRSFSATSVSSTSVLSQRESKPFSRKSSTDEEEALTARKTSQTDKEMAGPLSSRGISRRGAMSRRDKSKMEESRRKAKQMRDSRSPSSASGNEGVMGDRSSSCKEESTASPSPVHVPQIMLRKPTEMSVTLPKQSSVERELNSIEESRESHVGSHGFDHHAGGRGGVELRTSDENTPISSPVKAEFSKVSVKGDSLHYSTVEFPKAASTAKTVAAESDDLFTKVTPRKPSAPPTDAPKDTARVNYSTVEFTKTAPKPVIKDNSDEFAKVKSKASTTTTESFQRSKMATITEVSENKPSVPRHRKDTQGRVDKDSLVSSITSEAGSSPKVPSRSASLKRKSVPDAETPPAPPARVIPPTPRARDSPKYKRSLPELPLSESTPPPPVPHSRSSLPETTIADGSPPVPKTRARKIADETPEMTTVPRQHTSSSPSLPIKIRPSKPIVPALPPKDIEMTVSHQHTSSSPSVPVKIRPSKPIVPALPPKDIEMTVSHQHTSSSPSVPVKIRPSKPIVPALPPKDDSPNASKSLPSLPPKEDAHPPLPPKDDFPSVQPPLPLKDDSIPPKDDSVPVKVVLPPLPSKDDTPASSLPALPPKEDSSSSMPPLPPKDNSPTKPDSPPLPSKDDSPRVPTPRKRPPLPQKDKSLESPSTPEVPPLPTKDTSAQDPPSSASHSLTAANPMSRGAKARTTIRDKAVMGNLLDEFKKKQAKLQVSTEEEAEDKVEKVTSLEASKVTDPSLLSSPDASDPDRNKSPGSSPLRRKNATRTTRLQRGAKTTSGSSLTTSGEDFADNGDSFQFRRRSSAVRGRPSEAQVPQDDDESPQADYGRSRVRSRAVSGMKRPVRKGRMSEVAPPKKQGDLDEEFQRVSARSQSPAADGEKLTRL